MKEGEEEVLEESLGVLLMIDTEGCNFLENVTISN